MTSMKLKTGATVYTTLSVSEVRSYLQGGTKTGSFDGFEDQPGTIPIIIAVHAVVYVYK